MAKKDSTELVEAAALEAAETSPPIGGMPARAGRLPVTLRALRHRNFQLFFGGQLISLVGTWMQSLAQAWLVYRLTGSSLLLGIVAIRFADSNFSAFACWRNSGGSLQPAPRGDRHANYVDVAGGNSCGAHNGHWITVWELIVLGVIAGRGECV